MDEPERRSNYRVDAPAGFLCEAALWYGRERTGSRLTLENLGAPDVLGLVGGGGMCLVNVSTRGLRLRLTPEAMTRLRFSGGGLPAGVLHVYLKLTSPLSGGSLRCCTLFLETRVVHMEQACDAVLLGLHIIARGVPERTEKAFRMFDTESHGVKELTRWCDEVARMGRGLLPQPSPGLDLEHLLAEIDVACRDVVQANRN